MTTTSKEVLISISPGFRQTNDQNQQSKINVESQMSKVESKDQIIISQKISKEKYISKVLKILEHIHRGDIYEANFLSSNFVI